MYEWNQLPWRQLEKQVFKLQKRIYQASQRDDVRLVHRLQKLLMKSWAARCIAVRRVTQDNRGKRTAGIDGVKNLPPVKRLALVKHLVLTGKARPTRRIWIPKPGRNTQRPLGIPTIQERARQALVKLGLEPEWEAKFEPNSYGFRPGRSCHDALKTIFDVTWQKARYVLDADLTQCFDQIDHAYLLNKLQTFPTLRRQIRAWLKSGVIDAGVFSPTSAGTPQGGVISPLLANIALHGLETHIRQLFPPRIVKVEGKPLKITRPVVVRYADDFVIIHEELSTIQRCQQAVMEWLKPIGLTLNPSKTHLSHTLHRYEGNVGFDFLGFNVRQFPKSRNRTPKKNATQRLDFICLITPSKAKCKEQAHHLGEIIRSHKSASQRALIERLNPIIVGWSKYFSGVCSKRTFNKLDHILFSQLQAWAKYRHPNQSHRSINQKYWHSCGNRNWDFAVRLPKGLRTLYRHEETPIRRHSKVQTQRSPYDGDWIYWSTRMGRHPQARKNVAKLLKRQGGKCAHCGLFFRDGDRLELDHVVPTVKGGNDKITNRQLLHRHCHDVKTALDRSVPEVCMTNT
jgi:RNA-directed DNA polymerase